jgi:hypothetical protein
MEAAPVLDLHVGAGPVDPVAAVGDAGDLDPAGTPGRHHAGERRQRSVERPMGGLETVLRQPEESLDLGQQPVLLLVRDEAGRRVHGAERNRVHLDGAAGGDDRGAGRRAARSPERLA